VLGKNQIAVDKVRVLEFADLICAALVQWPRELQRRPADPADRYGGGTLERVKSKDGTTTTCPLSKKQFERGKTMASSIVRKCFICRGYASKKDRSKGIYINTSFCCTVCKMPLCNIDRRNEVGTFGTELELTCVEAHQQTSGVFGCIGHHPRGTEFPPQERIDLHPRRSNRNGR
jgi:hypothetical protein